MVQLAGIGEECRERLARRKPTQNLLSVGRECPCIVKKHPGAELHISHIVEICRMAPLDCDPLMLSDIESCEYGHVEIVFV